MSRSDKQRRVRSQNASVEAPDTLQDAEQDSLGSLIDTLFGISRGIISTIVGLFIAVFIPASDCFAGLITNITTDVVPGSTGIEQSGFSFMLNCTASGFFSLQALLFGFVGAFAAYAAVRFFR